MKLSIKERLQIQEFIPETGGIARLINAKGIIAKALISSDEANEIGLTDTGKGVVWDNSKAKEIDISFNESEIRILKEEVKRKDEQEAISMDAIDLAIKIQKA